MVQEAVQAGGVESGDVVICPHCKHKGKAITVKRHDPLWRKVGGRTVYQRANANAMQSFRVCTACGKETRAPQPSPQKPQAC